MVWPLTSVSCLLAQDSSCFDLVEITMDTGDSQDFLSSKRHFKLVGVQQRMNDRASDWPRPLNMPANTHAYLDVAVFS